MKDETTTGVEDAEGEDSPDGLSSSNLLPWYTRKERLIATPTSIQIETSLKPGEYVMRNLFAEFVIQADKKITNVMAEPFVSFVFKCCVLKCSLFCLSGEISVKITATR